MDKLHVQDSIEEGQAPVVAAPDSPAPEAAPEVAPVAPLVPPAPKPAPKLEEKIEEVVNEKSKARTVRQKKEVGPMDNDGIVIDLGDGISLNVPIKKRMKLSEFLSVAEKVKALEMLSEDSHHRY